jgi:hypothetical protein
MLSELAGDGWTMAEPPLERDGESVVARVDGKPIKAGFLTERIKDTRDKFHVKYRSGQYDLEVKVDFVSGHGQIRVEQADGYNHTEG